MFIIGCALLLSPHLEEPILGVAIGVVAGGVAQFVMQLPSLKVRGLLFGFRFEPGHPGVKRIGQLMIPSLLGMSVTQVNLTISTILASFIAGAPTYLFYGMRLIQFPLGIFGVALAMAILPTLSAQATRGAMEELKTTLGFGLRMIVFIMFPAMLGLIFLRTPIVHLFFEHGTFTAHDTAQTAMAVLCYAVGLWAFGGVRIIVAAFYSLQDTKTPAIAAAVAVAANIVFSLLLMSSLGASGLALATALAGMVNGGILIAVLNRRLGGVEWGSIGRSAGRVMVACIPLVLACLWVAGAQVWTHEGEWAAKSVMLAVAIGLSVSGYLGVHALFRSEELDLVWGMVRNKIGRMAGR
jgi:putative peptidoglycan lipid II flippase